MSMVDLHLHTTVSDGKHGPEEIVNMAAAKGLKYMAICDHDDIDGIPLAQAALRLHKGLTLIPGVEMSTDFPGGEAHVLGYFIDITNPELIATLKDMRQSRRDRAKGMVDRLGELGFPLDWERVRELAGNGSIGRPHIAEAMQEQGYIKSFSEAFEKYIGHGCPAYVERIKMTPSEAVKLILRSGGLPVLAHPLTVPEPEKMIIELKKAGLVGIEAYYGEFSAEEIGDLLDMARKHSLMATGGSDYHGIDESRETPIGGSEVPLEVAEQLIALKKKQTPTAGKKDIN